MGIGASCWGEVHGPEADDSKRNTVEEMTAAAVALDRVADGGDRDAALAALIVLDNRITDSGTVAHHQAAALSGAKPPTAETLRRFASEWRDMASSAVVTPTYSTPGRSLIAMYPSAPRDRR